MKRFMRGAAALLTAAALVSGSAAAQNPSRSAGTKATGEKAVLASERDRISYMVGLDIGASVAPVGSDLDLAAFEKAIRNAFAGGKPLLTPEEAKATGQALMARIAARSGQATAPAGEPVARDKVGLLVGTDVGRALAPIKDEIDFPVFLQAVRAAISKGEPLLDEQEATAVREAFSKKLQAKAAAAGERNKAEGAKFLAANKAAKGVVTTSSGLQYTVLRQGAGRRPAATDRVRVNYHGTQLDGSVFDSSYDRGEPAEFALNQVIPGWTEGLSLMPVGAKYRFWIPADLAYGAKGTPDGRIGPNSTLVFDVELLAILP